MKAGSRAVLALLTALFVVVVLRTAWIHDDAYITYRTVDNFVNGYGLRWNPAERVQTYTHPLWMFVVSAAYAVTHEMFFTVIFTKQIPRGVFELMVPGLRNQGNSPARRKQQQMAQHRPARQGEWRRDQQRSRAR